MMAKHLLTEEDKRSIRELRDISNWQTHCGQYRPVDFWTYGAKEFTPQSLPIRRRI